MKPVKVLHVYFKDQCVGTMAMTREGKAAFAYDDEWLGTGFAISPFSLPLEKKVYVPVKQHISGMFGVFADSLPDAWGNILLNRILKKNGVDPGKLTPLDRLAIVGNSGMGALTYRPEIEIGNQAQIMDLDKMAEECEKVLNAEYSEELDRLYVLGGTSGGARPKIMTELDGKSWIIKFPAQVDPVESGVMEYEYAQCAVACGIQMTETRLFPSKKCKGYFGTERFDRNGTQRIHMLTAAALLELNFEEPSMDYHSLMKLTKILTRDSKKDLEQMFARMCFNVFAHNRDDHSKNFTFLYNDTLDEWHLSPAYDLTYSNTYYGEHTTSVNGNGKDPSERDLLQVGLDAGLGRTFCLEKIGEIQDCVKRMLGTYRLCL